jgi:hypothetical protein
MSTKSGITVRMRLLPGCNLPEDDSNLFEEKICYNPKVCIKSVPKPTGYPVSISPVSPDPRKPECEFDIQMLTQLNLMLKNSCQQNDPLSWSDWTECSEKCRGN